MAPFSPNHCCPGTQGQLKSPPGLELAYDLEEARKTSGGYCREPDYIVGDKLVGWDWKSIFSVKALDKAHINVKELRAAMIWVRRMARRCHNTRCVCLIDSRVVVGALARGRSASKELNRNLRKFIPMCLASNLYFVPLWVPTGANPGDPPSRGRSLRPWLHYARIDARKRRRLQKRDLGKVRPGPMGKKPGPA